MRRYLAAAAASLGLFLMSAPGAAALEEAGNRCVANDSLTGAAVVGLSNQGPTSPFLQSRVVVAGVITRWRVEVAPAQAPLVQQLVLFQQSGPEESRKLAESAPQTVVAGPNEFATRIPVGENAYLGLQGPVATFVCDPQELNTAGVFTGGAWPSGETRHFEIKVNVGAPVVAVIEPDRDSDGFGDETQDGCPWNAALQAECPPVTPKVDSLAAREKAILVGVGVSSQAQVQVFGQVSWRVRRQAGQGPRPRQGDRGLTVGLTAGGPRTVLPGTVAGFRVPLTRPVLRRLGRLTSQQALKAQITIRTTDLAGRETDRLVTVKLRGRQR